MISNNLKKLSTTDIYSMLLFALFHMQKIPGYGVLSELIYILDKNSILKLCEYFGGQTIQIPTIDELEVLVYCLIVYNNVDLEGGDIEKTLKDLPVESHVLKQVRTKYYELRDLLNDYNFSTRP